MQLQTNDYTYTMTPENRNVAEARCTHCEWWTVGLAWLVIQRAAEHLRTEHQTVSVEA